VVRLLLLRLRLRDLRLGSTVLMQRRVETARRSTARAVEMRWLLLLLLGLL
jgi:hypothetical protein